MTDKQIDREIARWHIRPMRGPLLLVELVQRLKQDITYAASHIFQSEPLPDHEIDAELAGEWTGRSKRSPMETALMLREQFWCSGFLTTIWTDAEYEADMVHVIE